MINNFRKIGVAIAALSLCAGAVTQAQSVSKYRDYQLGATLATVVSQTHSSASDVKTLHERPAVLKELQWRRPYSVTALPGDAVDPVQGIAFSFYNDQLFRIAVDYERARTAEMTNQDMIDAVSTVYGVAVKPGVKPAATSGPADPEPGTRVAEWQGADFTAALYRSLYLSGYRLIVTSVPLGALAQTAELEARRMDDSEAPQRELARQKQEADATRDEQDKRRTTNKATFTP